MNVTSGGKKLRADSSDYSLHVAGPQLWALGLLSRVRGPCSGASFGKCKSSRAI